MEATDTERKDWMDEALMLAKKEKLGITAVETYEAGTVIRFASPDDPKKEADVYLWYKQIECWSELGSSFSSFSFNKNPIETIVEEKTGYRRDSHYDGFVKEVDTPEEAIEEVKIMVKKALKIGEMLDDLYWSIMHTEEGVEEEVSGKTSSKSDYQLPFAILNKAPRSFVEADLKEEKEKGKEKE